MPVRESLAVSPYPRRAGGPFAACLDLPTLEVGARALRTRTFEPPLASEGTGGYTGHMPSSRDDSARERVVLRCLERRRRRGI